MRGIGAPRGFTLIELLVVILIIGILAAIAVPQYQRVIDKMRYMQVLTIGRAIVQAQHMYYLTHSVYATSFSELDFQMPAGFTKGKYEGRELYYYSAGARTWYCHIGSSNVYCWLNSPTVGYTQNYQSAKGICVACASTNKGREARAAAICNSITGQQQVLTQDCQRWSF